MIIGCVYRHPGTNLINFNNDLEMRLHKINNEGCLSIISGDFNIDGLKASKDRHTNTLMPSITLPARITENSMTLIDNIFVNMNKNTMDSVLSGNIFSDISDHLPNFTVLCDVQLKEKSSNRPAIRLFGEKNIGKFVGGLSNMDWTEFYQNNNEILNIFYKGYSHHFINLSQ